MKKWMVFLLALCMLSSLILVTAYAATDETNFAPFKLTVTRTGAPEEGYKRLLIKNEFGFEPADNQLAGCLLNGTVTYTGSADYSKSVPLKDVEVVAQPARSDGNIALDFKVPDGYTMCTTDAEDKNYKWDITISPASKSEQSTGSQATVADTGMKDGFTYIVLAPGNYTDNGVWELEKDDSGITFMIAGRDGKPNLDKPATIKVALPKEGSYKIYALSKDYATDPGTRYYDVQLGDYKFSTGNHGKNGFFWQETDAFISFAGEYDFNVIDSHANHARSAMIVVTDDLTFNPGTSTADIKALAEKQYKVGDIKVAESISLEGRPSTEIAVKLNGEWMDFDVPPVLMNDRTMVPFRAIFEALGCTVSWNDETQTASGSRNGMKVELPIGNNIAKVDGESVVLDQSAVLLNDRTLVPLRFVSEALGAQVKWDDASQTVIILAEVPATAVLFTQSSFTDVGTWVMESNADGAFNGQAMRGLIPEGHGATLADADISNAKPAYIEFDLSKSGTYKVWVRSKDFATNQQGDRFFQLAFNNDALLPTKFGAHGGTGYAWASGGTVQLNAGDNVLYVHDTSGFYARFDAIFLTEDMEYVPSENYDSMLKIAKPYTHGIETTSNFPAYATELTEPTESIAIENAYTKVVFYKVPTSRGQVVQNEIYSKVNGQWVKTNGREEPLGHLLMQAVEASSGVSQDIYSLNAKFEADGKVYGSGLTANPYDAGLGTWFIPTDYTVADNAVTLTFEAKDEGTMTATWSLDENAEPKVSVDTTFAKAGYYSIGVSEGGSFAEEDIEFALAPFRVQYKRIPEKAELLTEQYLFTPMGTYTLYENNKYSQAPVTKGVVAEPSWIPQRWVYADNSMLGITMRNENNMCSGTLFAPVMGVEESKMEAGETYNLQYRVVSRVGTWFDSFKSISTNLFDVNDYRENYLVSLNDTIFNTRELMLDDVYSGWDVYDKAHYNMEGKHVTSQGNPMQAMQDYLLSEDEDLLTRRAIPTIANMLTRRDLHFNRTGLVDGATYWAAKTEPDSIGTPIAGFNANIAGGMYEMTRGAVPFLHNYSVEKGSQTVVNSYGNIAEFSNDLAMYKYTGEQKYLDSAIQKADDYLINEVYAEHTGKPVWDSFIYISYYPNLASLIDIYEVTNDKKYLDAAVDVANWMTTGLWVPGIDGTKKTDPVIVNSQEVIDRFVCDSETSKTFWWHGGDKFRIGRTEDLYDVTASNENILSRQREVEGWLPSRVGLGIEQASTFTGSGNIVMQSFVGDFMKLSAYTGDDYFATVARNAIIGRFKSYDGYYRTSFMTYPQEIDYPREGPDYNSLYWHHIPTFLAMLEDFLIGQTMAWSGNNIHFPSLRQQGYAYFNSNQYGHEPGVFYNETDMWPWLTEGIVTTGNIQIDWMAARKDGVLGVAFMNESAKDVTTVVTLGDKIPNGASYNGTADLFDKNGKIGTVEVVNGSFSLNVPAKALSAVVMKMDTVKAPAFSAFTYSDTKAEIGGTVSEHTNGKGYTLQMSPDSYYAYVYVTDKTPMWTEESTEQNPKYVASSKPYVKELTITYDVGGEKKTETTNVYPFEFIIKVDDVNKVFNYTLTATLSNGSKESRGSGKLMTAAVSSKQGIVFEEKKEEVKQESAGTSNATAEAKALKFDAFDVKYSAQGTDATNYRFVMNLADIPFTPDEKNVVGLPVRGKLVDGGNEIDVDTYILKYEARGADGCVLTVAPIAEAPVSAYGSTTESSKAYSWKVKIYPYGK